jgi:hypothetical protein
MCWLLAFALHRVLFWQSRRTAIAKGSIQTKHDLRIILRKIKDNAPHFEA